MIAHERYITAAELAELMGVSERTIRRMVTAGMPSVTWGMGHTRRFLPSQAVAWARDRATMGVVNASGERSNATGPEPRR
jgi:excisionase family DNA binding protein